MQAAAGTLAAAGQALEHAGAAIKQAAPAGGVDGGADEAPAAPEP